MKIFSKKNIVLLIAMLVASVSLSSGAMAASSFNFPFKSSNFSGGVSLGTNSAIAYTNYGHSSGLSARVTYNYRHGSIFETHTVTVTNSANSTSVVATANAIYVPAVNVSAHGYHTVYYDGSGTTAATDVYN